MAPYKIFMGVAGQIKEEVIDADFHILSRGGIYLYRQPEHRGKNSTEIAGFSGAMYVGFRRMG